MPAWQAKPRGGPHVPQARALPPDRGCAALSFTFALISVVTVHSTRQSDGINRTPTGIGSDGAFVSGAPRPMKMGTVASQKRYDAASSHALQPVNLRRPALLHYASWPTAFPISQGEPALGGKSASG